MTSRIYRRKDRCPILLYVGEEFDANFYYYTGLEVTNAFVLLWDKKYLFVHQMDTGLVKGFKGEIIVTRNAIKEILKMIKGRCVYIDKSMPYGIVRLFENNTRILDGTKIIREKRMKKTNKELKYITKAVKETVKLISEIETWGRKEEDVARELYSRTYELGFEPSFSPIVATKRNAGVPHHLFGKDRIKDMVLIDYGLKYKHYHADITRCFFEHEKNINKPYVKMYERIKGIAYEIIDNVPNFETASDLASFSEDLFRKNKLKKLIHLIGHGIGLDVHEKPLLSKKSNDKLEGTTLAIEPGYYTKQYGVRFEIDIHIKNGKARIIEKQ